MKHQQLTARDKERQLLSKLLLSKQPELLVLYGRRRVGKTWLIRKFFENQPNILFFNATGSKDGPMHEQIKHFTERLGEVFFNGAALEPARNWDGTLRKLKQAIEPIPRTHKVVIFLDELPWMATKRSRLLESIDYYWNQYWSNDARIKLIICGSSAAWMIKKIINNKGGLHNRMTYTIKLKPFTLKETKQFLHHRGIRLSDKQTTELYMVMGGIPYYLSHVQKGESATEAIERLAFREGGVLLKEFDHLFTSLFDEARPYIELLYLLAKNRDGTAQSTLAKQASSISKGGRLVEKLDALKEAGFILPFTPYQNRKKGVYYRIVDEYTLFYFHWIEPLRNNLQVESIERGYWESIRNSPKGYSWSGYAFEALCYKHLTQIRKALNISPAAIANGWRYVPKAGSKETGAQIDLLFDRPDDNITLCEIKYTQKPFVIDKAFAKILLNKKSTFIKRTHTPKHIFLSMITPYGIKPNLYADDLIQGITTLKDFF